MKRILKWLKGKKTTVIHNSVPIQSSDAVIISRSEHCISRAHISKNAIKVLYRLKDEGFQAYLVGGGVRDLLLNRYPKDFDIATNAHPEQIYKLFRNCRLIGRRFRLAHVFFGAEIIEVATFRGGNSSDVTHAHSEQGMILRDNIYGTLEEDVWRRDFTINALYYNIANFAVEDFVGGWQDLENKSLKLIGDAAVRYREDPVRMLRAIRFAAKLGFTLHPSAELPIFELRSLVQHVPPARIFEEYLKMFLGGHALQTFKLLRHYHLFEILFPQTEAILQIENENIYLNFLETAFVHTDDRVQENKSVAPPFLLAVLLWQPMLDKRDKLLQQGMDYYEAHHEAMDYVLQKQQKFVAIPKRFTLMIREIWSLQARLAKRSGRKAKHVFHSIKFRAGYDFLLLRAEAGDSEVTLLSEWWTEYIHASPEMREEMASKVKETDFKRKRSRRKKT